MVERVLSVAARTLVDMTSTAARTRPAAPYRSRAVPPAGGGVLVVGDLVLEEAGRRVSRGGAEIRLTGREFELLRFLMRNPCRVLSKSQILDRVWDRDLGGRPNIVELYISYLRRKVDAGREPMIHTRRGVGYLIRPVGDGR
ncbi:winged helix-turn-helix transcriptional regulator [Streptomyces sp. ISL-11]|nr:winged helix-turn-helix transcriptional regulator [Streptomyces sp. ISL-11]